MVTPSEVQEPEVYEILKKAVQDGLDHIRELELQNKYIGTYFRFPELKWQETGLPSITTNDWTQKGPTDYKAAFNKEYTQQTESWQAFLNIISKYPKLQRYYCGEDKDLGEFGARLADSTIKGLTDRYIHISGKTDFDENPFRRVYTEWERCALLDELPFDILVPIIFVKFDFDSLELSDDILIVEMPEKVQLARMVANSYGRSLAEELVAGAATHVLVLRYWILPNVSWFQRANTFGSIETFSAIIDKVDNFFAALRVVTGIETGYSQLVVYPDNWGDRWTAHLPYVKVLSKRAYPDHFDDGGWRNVPPLLSEQQCRAIFAIFTAVSESKSNKLALACRRLNMAHLRRTEEDAILDITIALEALLANDSHSEIAYRLAMRLGALSRIEPFEEHTPTEIVGICKKIYGFRSSVVHGSHDIDKKRIIPVKSSLEPIPAVTLGLSLLRYVIRVLSQHPNLLQIENLDKFLLCGPTISETS